jgi:hypothetical protein
LPASREALVRRAAHILQLDQGAAPGASIAFESCFTRPLPRPWPLSAAPAQAGAPALIIRLFFERALVMEGDTEFGLMIKNTLDAIGPLWAGSARWSQSRGARR